MQELIENLTVLRFANLVFEPLWTRQYIRNVQVSSTQKGMQWLLCGLHVTDHLASCFKT
jgi:hypothetical protein